MKKLSLLPLLLTAPFAAQAIVIDFQQSGSAIGAEPGALVFEVPGDAPYTETFTDAFGAGQDLTLSYERDNPRDNGAAITGGPFAGSLLLADWVGARGTSDSKPADMILDMTLPAGIYAVTGFIHRSDRDGANNQALVDVTVDGGLIADDLVTSVGASPSAVSSFQTTFTTDGLTPVSVLIENVQDGGQQATGLTGLELEVIPEPSTVALSVLGLGALFFLARRRR